MKSTMQRVNTRTFTYRPPAWTGIGPFTETCPGFCRTDHTGDLDAHPEDLWHQQLGPSIRTPLASTEGVFVQHRVLEAQLTLRTHATGPAEQVPHVAVEFYDGVWTPPMDPDQLAEFTNRLAGHVDNLRIMHTQLVAALDEHQAGGQ